VMHEPVLFAVENGRSSLNTLSDATM